MFNDFVDDAVCLGREKALEAFLNDVVAILILNQFNNVVFEFCHEILLLFSLVLEELYGFLDDSAAKDIKR